MEVIMAVYLLAKKKRKGRPGRRESIMLEKLLNNASIDAQFLETLADYFNEFGTGFFRKPSK